MITLTQLEYIVAVDTYRHFGKAAEHCFITQPTLSMQIKKLEEDLGVVIFDRTKQPLIPTDVGERIIEQSRVLLKQAEKINDIVLDHKNVISGELKIGIIPTLGPYLLPLFIGNYKRKYPNISISVEELTTAQIVDALNKDLVDVGILVTPLKEERISERPLFYEEMKIFFHPNHPLLHEDTINVKDIPISEIWLLGDGHCFRHQVINLCSSGRSNGELPFHFETGSLETILNIIDKEGGLTLIPELATKKMMPERLKRVRAFSDITPLREVSIVHSRHFAKNKLIELLRREIIDSVGSQLLIKDRGTIVEWK